MPHRTRAALPSLRLLHTSDCHLGKEPGVVAAFHALLDACREQEVDALLIVGDLFDSTAVPDEIVQLAVEGLSGIGVPAVILPGNHDPIGPHSVYERFRAAGPAAHVHVLELASGSWLSLPDLKIKFWGRPTRVHTPDFRPLADAPPPPADAWGVLLAHGQVLPTDEPTLYGSPIYPRDLTILRWDYLALGHADRFQLVNGYAIPACYPGDTASSLRADAGAVIVQLEPETPEQPVALKWIRLRPARIAPGRRAPAASIR